MRCLRVSRPAGSRPVLLPETALMQRCVHTRQARGRLYRLWGTRWAEVCPTVSEPAAIGDCASGRGPRASSPLVRQAITPPMQDYGTLAAAHQHCEPLLKATPTVRLQATRDAVGSCPRARRGAGPPSPRVPRARWVCAGQARRGVLRWCTYPDTRSVIVAPT